MDQQPLPMQTWRVVRADTNTAYWGLTPWTDETWTIECLAPARNYLGVMQERRFHSPRVAICALMAERSEPIVEIVAPGEMTAAEQVAAMWARCGKACAEIESEGRDAGMGIVSAGARACCQAIAALVETEDDE